MHIFVSAAAPDLMMLIEQNSPLSYAGIFIMCRIIMQYCKFIRGTKKFLVKIKMVGMCMMFLESEFLLVQFTIYLL